MLIFVPMSGFGERYKRAGYTQPKPLIPVDGVTMIERVLDCFPKDARYLFAINSKHAQETDLPQVLRRLRPQGTTVVVEPHRDGPVRTVLGCLEHIPDDEPVILNYCDFGVTWSYPDFVAWLDKNGWDGAMTAYRGFHPHSLGPTLYAYMRNDGERVTEIREKHHFTSNKLAEYASSGLYYFRRGADLKRLSHELVQHGERVNNEFYASMLMQRLIEQGGRVGVYELQRFFQWGTPEDLRDYEAWAQAMGRLDDFRPQVRALASPASQVIPMAGRGQRFVDQGYRDPKPLIEVAGGPMIARAVESLPTPPRRVFVAQRSHADDPRFQTVVAGLQAPSHITTVDAVTAGQACTALLGMPHVDRTAPVLFASCDAGYVYDPEAWQRLEQAGDADVIVWGARGHLPAIWRPQMYGWMQVEGGCVRQMAVKKPVDGVPLAEQAVVTGTFWFRDGALYESETQALLAADDRVNNEFYIDTIARRMVERGARVRVFLVDKYVPWGTPEELLTFNYWNDVFRGGRPLT